MNSRSLGTPKRPTRSSTIRRSGTLAAALAALCLWLAATAVALAHARYDHSTPGQSEVVQSSPARVDIYTAQNMQKVQGTYAIVVQRDESGTPGQQVDQGDTTLDDGNRSHFFVDLQPNLPQGRYLVSFKNTSDIDQEADHGQFAFYVGAGPTPAQKTLDSQLAITAQAEDVAKPSNSHTALFAGIVAAVVVVVVGAGWRVVRRRRPVT
ncbi:MAG: copper resistance protein CopC, partial [Dehalococcoidia bacterium]